MKMADDGAQPLYSWLDFHDDARSIIAQLKQTDLTITQIIAIPRGGVVLGALLSYAFEIPLKVQSFPEPNDPTSSLVVDDNAITGGSLAPFFRRGMPVAVLVKHPFANVCSPFIAARESDEMYLFPWEVEGAQHSVSLDDVVAHNCDAIETEN